jgi:putative DNA methylase
VVISQIRTSLDDTYFPKRPHLIAMAQYIAEMLDNQHFQEAQKAQIISDRIRNEGLGT